MSQKPTPNPTEEASLLRLLPGSLVAKAAFLSTPDKKSPGGTPGERRRGGRKISTRATISDFLASPYHSSKVGFSRGAGSVLWIPTP